MDAYLVYASSALVVMGVVALVLSFVFRLRRNRLEAVAEGSVATVFDRTFAVFDPYGGKRTIFHRFLALMAFVPLLGGVGLSLLVFVMIGSGLLLTLLVVILALGLIVVEESSEVYSESRALVRAIEGRSRLGVGDVKLLEVTRRMLPRLTFYYLGLGVALFALAAVLPYVWSGALLYFAVVLSYMLQLSAMLGPAGSMLTPVLLMIMMSGFIAVVSFVKNRLFGYHLEGVIV